MKSAIVYFGIAFYIGLLNPAWANQDKSDYKITNEQAHEVVKKLYHEKLGREPDPEGLAHHVQLLIDEGKSPEWLATVFEDSKEGRILKKSKKQILFGIALILIASFLFCLTIFLVSQRSRWIPRFLYVAWVILLIEVTFRIYFTSVYRVDFFHPKQAIKNITLKSYALPVNLQRLKKQNDSNECRVLLLGGSVLDPVYGTFVAKMKSHLSNKGINNIKVFNFARGGHGTHDSRFKFVTLLEDYQFDFVVIYHGINDVRANNCPDDIYREDFSHYLWYEDLNIADRHLQGITFSIIPYTTDLIHRKLRQKLFPEKYIPTDKPRPEWLEYGATLKTVPAFRSNLEAIIEAARSRSTKVLLTTFAYYYVPPEHTKHASEQQKLSYTGWVFPIAMWGKSENVIKGIKAHNGVVRELADQNNDILFLDMEELLPKEGKYFRDICHPSLEGDQALTLPISELLAQECGKKDR